MGLPMAGFIVRAGYPLVVFSRNPANRSKLVSQGAQEATSIAQCAAAADVVFSSISDDAALREVALGPQGVLANIRRGAVFADTSTVSVEVSAEVDREAARRGVAYLRLPISGNAASAQKGEITALVSGPEAAWNTAKPVVEAFSKVQVYLGGSEEARYMKLVINAMVVNLAQGMAEAFALGRKAGLEWRLMLDTIGQSTIASPWLKAKVALMKARDFTPTMTTRLILKDLDLILSAARAKA
ncbi:MAG: NAD(P)-dependent oxidoreductase, partial [Dongiaceae bacterium]